MLFSFKGKGNSIMCHTIDESRWPCPEWDEAVTEWHVTIWFQVSEELKIGF